MRLYMLAMKMSSDSPFTITPSFSRTCTPPSLSPCPWSLISRLYSSVILPIIGPIINGVKSEEDVAKVVDRLLDGE